MTERARMQLADQFVIYLLHQQTFHNCMDNCVRVIERTTDSPQERRARRRSVKAALSTFIGSQFYTTRFRPALMRMSIGDGALAKRMGIEKAVTIMHARCRAACRRAARKCAHRVDMIGPRHADALEAMVLQRTRPHASKFAWRRAKFLSMGENGREGCDTLGDLQCMAIRSFRWYYPFRAGTHMDNTVRSTITNRGLSYVKHHTRQCRSRLVTDDNGVTQNVEAHDEIAVDRYTANSMEERDAILRIDVERLCSAGGTVGAVARLISNPTYADKFLSWVQHNYPRSAKSEDVPDVIRATGLEYDRLLADYLVWRREPVHAALQEIRAAA